MTDRLPPYVPKALVAERLRQIFPEGTPNRSYCTRDLAASTVFTMLYIGAAQGAGRYLAPKHVYTMSDIQAAIEDDEARLDYARAVLQRGYRAAGKRWYADNTREPIRDETLREGLIPLGAAVARDDLPTTSSKPRYALSIGFAALFDPASTGKGISTSIARWQEANLSAGALARIAIIRRGAAANTSSVLVRFPNGETRLLAPGPSAAITRAMIEEFAPRFLKNPAVLWISESGNKVVARDDVIASAIGLRIEPDKNLPDVILADLGPREPLIVFVEVVATDGAVTERRQSALFALTDAAGFKRTQIAFVTAYQHRESAAFRKTVPGLAWGSFAWFASEPRHIVLLRDGVARDATLHDLIEA